MLRRKTKINPIWAIFFMLLFFTVNVLLISWGCVFIAEYILHNFYSLDIYGNTINEPKKALYELFLGILLLIMGLNCIAMGGEVKIEKNL